MRIAFRFAAAALAVFSLGSAHAASPASCSVSHHECYPACVRMNADGSDCAKTRNICRDVCGPKASYPSADPMDANRFEAPGASSMVPPETDRYPLAEPLPPSESIAPPSP